MKEGIVVYSEVLMDGDGISGGCIRHVMAEGGIDLFPDGDNSKYRLEFLLPQQTHSLNVGVVESREDTFPDTDSLVTFMKGVPIGVLTADCVPILIYAEDVKGIAAVHAGWKGTLGGIVENTIDVLERYGAVPANMKVAFGPSISSSIYEVNDELAKKFIKEGFNDFVSYPNGRDHRPHLDLQGINKQRMIVRGIKEENIWLHTGCSFDSVYDDGRHKYYSHRRSKGGLGRNLTFIKLIDEEER